MIALPRALARAFILSFSVITLFIVSFIFREQDCRYAVNGPGLTFKFLDTGGTAHQNKKSPITTENLSLNAEECKAAFPGLTKEIDDNIRNGPFVFRKSNPNYQGLVQGRIIDGKLHILTTASDRTPEIMHQRTAILSQIHRALLTSPDALPNTHFAFVINDSPKNNSWVFAKPNKNATANMWLMPHFGFWSWVGRGLGTLDDVLSRIAKVESSTTWENKSDKVVWRGTPWFNPVGLPTLRQDLLKATKGKEWADIEAFNVTAQGQRTNAILIEDFCNYKYIVYTEGVTYSGRLPYHQACASVLLTPPLTYLTQTAHHLRPISAEDLMAAFDKYDKSNSPAFNGPPPRVDFKIKMRPLLPTVSDWRVANTIYLDRSFSNLEATILFLQSHPDVAKHLARNQRDTVVGGGYLSPAAGTCYWRALIMGWASVAVVDVSWGDEVGERYEEWILRQVEAGHVSVRGKSGKPG